MPVARAERASAQAMRKAVLNAALELFASQGFAATTTRAIAAAARIEQGHLAYYFPTKESLWQQTIAYANAGLIELLSGAPAEGTPRSEMLAGGRRILGDFLDFFADNREAASLINQEFSLRSPRHVWLLHNIVTPTWVVLKPLFRELSKDRRIAVKPAHLYYQFIGGALLFFSAPAAVRKATDSEWASAETAAFIESHLNAIFDGA